MPTDMAVPVIDLRIGASRRLALMLMVQGILAATALGLVAVQYPLFWYPLPIVPAAVAATFRCLVLHRCRRSINQIRWLGESRFTLGLASGRDQEAEVVAYSEVGPFLFCSFATGGGRRHLVLSEDGVVGDSLRLFRVVLRSGRWRISTPKVGDQF